MFSRYAMLAIAAMLLVYYFIVTGTVETAR